MVVQRASLNDLTELATETATGPQQIAAILRLEAAISCSMVRQALAQRLAGVPRLRQRLMPTAVGLDAQSGSTMRTLISVDMFRRRCAPTPVVRRRHCRWRRRQLSTPYREIGPSGGLP